MSSDKPAVVLSAATAAASTSGTGAAAAAAASTDVLKGGGSVTWLPASTAPTPQLDADNTTSPNNSNTNGKQRLRVLDFNIWGVPIATDRARRVLSFCQRMKSASYDIIGIQEAFIEGDRQAILENAREVGLIYSHYFHSGQSASCAFPLV
jgi:hypothetical protein